MPVRHDALDAHAGRAQQLRELLVGAPRRKIGKQVPGRGHWEIPFLGRPG